MHIRFIDKKKIYFIAEIGVNHNANTKLAKRMILSAKKAGADAVKFQTFKTDNLVVPGTVKVQYQKKNTPKKQSHYEMLRSLELSDNQHRIIYRFCKKKKIEFLSTPYDISSAKFLNKLGCKVFKTASADIVDLSLHEYLAKNNKTVLISTGMSNFKEINDCINIYKKFKNRKFILLHCVSNYPCSDKSINMKVLKKMQDYFNCVVGYSDHSHGNEASILSVAFGAKVIERHFTINKNLPGPDQSTSLLPKDFSEMVKSIKKSELIMGKPIKHCQPEEKEMLKISRKSLTISKMIKKNDIIKKECLTLKRPGKGLYEKELKNIIGRRARKNLKKDYQPKLKDFK
jgi:N-acetylneuraminate synthase/N,N'-diacetyllegionaminate synthase